MDRAFVDLRVLYLAERTKMSQCTDVLRLYGIEKKGLRFELLKTIIAALNGLRGKGKYSEERICDDFYKMDLNLEPAP